MHVETRDVLIRRFFVFGEIDVFRHFDGGYGIAMEFADTDRIQDQFPINQRSHGVLDEDDGIFIKFIRPTYHTVTN